MKSGKFLSGVVALLTAFLVATGLSPARAADEPLRPGRMPGLPFVPCIEMPEVPCYTPTYADDYNWINFTQLGMTGSVKAKQWARIPIAVLGNVAQVGYGYPAPNPPEYENGTDFYYELRSFFTSPKGSKYNYGLSPIIPVRTVAFGSIPVQVEVQIGQRRDKNGLPYPLRSSTRDEIRNGIGGAPVSRVRLYPAKLDEQVHVYVRKVTVDGVRVALGPNCGTTSLARLSVRSEYVEDTRGEPPFQNDGFDPRHGFYGLSGGSLAGTIDIPSFSKCSTSTGDDLSPLLSAAISGPGNPVDIVVGEMSCVQQSGDETNTALPPAPGSNTPQSINCKRFSPNPKVKVVPDPLPFPDEAPGETP